MASTALSQLLLLLAFSVLIVVAFRRAALPPILGYLAVGMLLGPQGLHLAANNNVTEVLSELGVVFLLFTLGLEFSLPRMMAMRREVFVVGGTQVAATLVIFSGAMLFFDVHVVAAIIIGGALAMSSTAIVIGQLGEQLEINRTHGRLAVGILLFQDLAFVPLLAMESAFAGKTGDLDPWAIALAIAEAAVALGVVLVAGRALIRPVFHEIARSRSSELFAPAALLIAVGAAWGTHAIGLSTALGAFLAGMLLGETEYRHQVESVIRPFRDVLLGLFFISIGTLLDMRLLWEQGWLVLVLLLGVTLVKTAVVTLVVKRMVASTHKAVRTGLVVAQGGEFGFALLTLLLNDQLASAAILQPLLAATVVSMAIAPMVIRHSGTIASWIVRSEPVEPSDLERELASTREAAGRAHVIICGFGRVGQNLARALERQGFEYIALDMDPQRTRAARNAGEPVIFGDATQSNILQAAGLSTCSVLVITFADPEVAMRILRAVRELRPDVPVLVRTQDDRRLEDLQRAGATEIVPETLEASLMLVSHVLILLNVPISRVVRVVGDIRADRYAMLRRLFRSEQATGELTTGGTEELRTVALTPGAHAVGKSLRDLQLDVMGVTVTAIRRDGIVGRQPDPELQLREEDVLVLSGTPEAISRVEAHLLMG